MSTVVSSMSPSQTDADTLAIRESGLATLEAREISAWFGDNKVPRSGVTDHAGRDGHRAHRAVRLW